MESNERRVKLQTELNWDHIREFYLVGRLGTGARYRWMGARSWRTYLVGFVAIFAVSMLAFTLDRTMSAFWWGAGTFVVVFGWYAFDGRFRRKQSWDKGWESFKADPRCEHMIGRVEYEFSSEGASETRGEVTSWCSWQAIDRIEVQRGALYLHCGPATAFILPEESFSSPQSAEQLATTLSSWKAAATGPARVPRADGAEVTRAFDLSEPELRVAMMHDVLSWVPKWSDIGWSVLPAAAAIQLWPWTQPLSARVIGPACGLWLLYRFVGTRISDRLYRRRHSKAHYATPAGRSSFTAMSIGISPDGLSEASSNRRHDLVWADIVRVVPGTRVTSFFNRQGGVFVLPVSAFESVSDYFDFVEAALNYRSAAAERAA